MSELQSLRLAQFWGSTLKPALVRARQFDPISTAALYEAAGWLNHGVFVRYFDRVDADLVWIQIRDRMAELMPPDELVSEGQLSQVRSLVQTYQPFREIELATEGESQVSFEIRLLPVALLNADRFAADTLATVATKWIWRDVGQDDDTIDFQFSNVGPEQLARELSAGPRDLGPAISPNLDIVAGCVRLLEHMHASNEFFSYAERLSHEMSIDFDSVLRPNRWIKCMACADHQRRPGPPLRCAHKASRANPSRGDRRGHVNHQKSSRRCE